MTEKETLETAYKYSFDKLMKARNLTFCAHQTAMQAMKYQYELEAEFNAIAEKLNILTGIEEVERKVNDPRQP